jgi:hypothetical protein
MRECGLRRVIGDGEMLELRDAEIQIKDQLDQTDRIEERDALKLLSFSLESRTIEPRRR